MLCCGAGCVCLCMVFSMHHLAEDSIDQDVPCGDKADVVRS